MQPITGKTRILFILGDPVAHIIGSSLLNEHFAGCGIDAAVSPLHVAPQDLPALIRTLRTLRNVAGFGVTIPHKGTMMGIVDDLTPMAKLCGATNVIRRDPDGRLVGGQFDGLGLTQSIIDAGHELSGRAALLAGAGGTARPVAFALAESGITRLEIANRTIGKAEALAAEVRAAYPECDARLHDGGTEFDVVVNTTSLGMQADDALPVAPDAIRPGVVVADAVMAPPETALLKLARERGATAHPGIRMLRAQFERTVEFLGLKAER